MVDKFRLGLALQPIATALFANSPFKEQKKTGYLSWRSHVWTDTDPDRCVGGRMGSAWEGGEGGDVVNVLVCIPVGRVGRV